MWLEVNNPIKSDEREEFKNDKQYKVQMQNKLTMILNSLSLFQNNDPLTLYHGYPSHSQVRMEFRGKSGGGEGGQIQIFRHLALFEVNAVVT